MNRFQKHYTSCKIIANGGFGKIVYAITNKYNLPRAVKIVDLSMLDLEEEREQQRNEVIFLQEMSGQKFFPTIYEVWEEYDKIYIVMELLHIDLQSFIRDFHPEGIKDVRVIYWIMSQVLEGLSILHQRKIIHRDIKPENLMISSSQIEALIQKNGEIDSDFMNHSTIKIIDLGVSKKMDSKILTETYTGTEKYLAPEIQQGLKYSFPVDIYSLGNCLFFFVTGNENFRTDKVYSIPIEIQKLISLMVMDNPDQRAYAQLLLEQFQNLLSEKDYQIDMQRMMSMITKYKQRTVIRFKPKTEQQKKQGTIQLTNDHNSEQEQGQKQQNFQTVNQ